MKKVIVLVLIAGLIFWWFKDPSVSVDSNDISFDYIIKYSGGSSRGDLLPMLISLHGNGDKAKNFYQTALNQFKVPVRIVLIKGPLSYGMGEAWPWKPDGFSLYGKAFSEAATKLAQKYPTNGKPVLMGFSGGGGMAYYQALKFGDNYSKIFPISGRLSLDSLGNDQFRIGADVTAFHGNKDSVLPISGGKHAAALLEENGVVVEFIEFDGGHLGIFTNMKRDITRAIEETLEML